MSDKSRPKTEAERRQERLAAALRENLKRRKMQARFGDAGHGFILIANPWEWYYHNDVSHGSGDGWNANRITGPLAGTSSALIGRRRTSVHA